MNKKEILTETAPQETRATKGFSRRKFLGLTGGLLATGVLLDACNKDDNNAATDGVTLVNNDYGILNYANVLEQLTTAFFTKITEVGFYQQASDKEKAAIIEILNHDIAHRELFKAAASAQAIGKLAIQFNGVDFSSRETVLKLAKTLKDLTVAAYNGAAIHISNPGYVTLIAKAASVEARHAAYFSNLITEGSFANSGDAVDMNGMEISKNPSVVLAAASTYISTKINSQLP